MDFQTLTNLFATTYDPNPNVRKAGELDIRKVRGGGLLAVLCNYTEEFCLQIGREEGMITAVLHIIGSENVELCVSLSPSTHPQPIERVERVSAQIFYTGVF